MYVYREQEYILWSPFFVTVFCLKEKKNYESANYDTILYHVTEILMRYVIKLIDIIGISYVVIVYENTQFILFTGIFSN